jgi:hypothetical protein
MIRREFLPRGLRDCRAKLRERVPVDLECARRRVALELKVMKEVVGETVALRAFQSAASVGENLKAQSSKLKTSPKPPSSARSLQFILRLEL